MIIEREPDLTYRILKAAHDARAQDDLFWRCDVEGQPITFWVHCGAVHTQTPRSTDLHQVTADNVSVLEDAVGRVRLLAPDQPALWRYAYMLFACRVTSARPTAAAYPQDFPQLWPWLDIAGPARRLQTSDEPTYRLAPQHMPRPTSDRKD